MAEPPLAGATQLPVSDASPGLATTELGTPGAPGFGGRVGPGTPGAATPGGRPGSGPGAGGCSGGCLPADGGCGLATSWAYLLMLRGCPSLPTTTARLLAWSFSHRYSPLRKASNLPWRPVTRIELANRLAVAL